LSVAFTIIIYAHVSVSLTRHLVVWPDK